MVVVNTNSRLVRHYRMNRHQIIMPQTAPLSLSRCFRSLGCRFLEEMLALLLLLLLTLALVALVFVFDVDFVVAVADANVVE